MYIACTYYYYYYLLTSEILSNSFMIHIIKYREHPDNTKAYFRRSKARQSMALFHEALEDLDAMIEIDPSLKDDVLREKAILIKAAKDASNKQKKEFRSFFAR